jgi:hypothetical protein
MRSSIRFFVAVVCFAVVASLSGSAQVSFWGPGLCENMHSWSNSVTLSTTVVTTADEVRVRQFTLYSSFTVGHVTTILGNGSFSGTTFNFGIYDSSGSLLLDSGPFNGYYTENGLVQTLSVSSVTLPAGTYYFAQTASETSIQPFGVGGGSSNILAGDYIANANASRFAVATNSASGGALPATLGALSVGAEEFNPTGTGAPLFEP